MCLYSDTIKTKLHSKKTINKAFTFYKDFEFNSQGNGIRTPFVGEHVDYFTLDFIEAKGDLCFDGEAIAGGAIHARQVKRQYGVYTNEIRIPIIVYSNDIIAFGINGDVCFFRYKISKRVWNWIEKILGKSRNFSNKELVARIYPSTLLYYSSLYESDEIYFKQVAMI